MSPHSISKLNKITQWCLIIHSEMKENHFCLLINLVHSCWSIIRENSVGSPILFEIWLTCDMCNVGGRAMLGDPTVTISNVFSQDSDQQAHSALYLASLEDKIAGLKAELGDLDQKYNALLLRLNECCKNNRVNTILAEVSTPFHEYFGSKLATS